MTLLDELLTDFGKNPTGMLQHAQNIGGNVSFKPDKSTFPVADPGRDEVAKPGINVPPLSETEMDFLEWLIVKNGGKATPDDLASRFPSALDAECHMDHLIARRPTDWAWDDKGGAIIRKSSYI